MGPLWDHYVHLCPANIFYHLRVGSGTGEREKKGKKERGSSDATQMTARLIRPRRGGRKTERKIHEVLVMPDKKKLCMSKRAIG